MLREARAITRRVGVADPARNPWLADHVEASLATGAVDEAAEIAAELRAIAQRLGRPALHALAGRCTGLVQAAAGRTDQGLRNLTAVARSRAESRFEHARSLLALGTVARRARRKAAAREALVSARAIFTAMGAALWAERAAVELQRVGLRSSPGTLTETERRIAALVTTGLTNRQVAAELFLAVKTVEANLSRIYHKLHITSRTQLARALADNPNLLCTGRPAGRRPAGGRTRRGDIGRRPVRADQVAARRMVPRRHGDLRRHLVPAEREAGHRAPGVERAAARRVARARQFPGQHHPAAGRLPVRVRFQRR
jgi:DNA-binding CsgD family transcriptional regulator